MPEGSGARDVCRQGDDVHLGLTKDAEGVDFRIGAAVGNECLELELELISFPPSLRNKDSTEPSARVAAKEVPHGRHLVAEGIPSMLYDLGSEGNQAFAQ